MIQRMVTVLVYIAAVVCVSVSGTAVAADDSRAAGGESETPVHGGVLRLESRAQAADRFSLRREGANLVVQGIAGSPQNTADRGRELSIPLDRITSRRIEVASGGDDDVLVVDSSLAGYGLEILYDGGGQRTTFPGDVLELTGQAEDLSFSYFDASSGLVDIVDGGELLRVRYQNLEPISSTINASNVTLTFGATAETITVSAAGPGQTTVSSTAGETTTFNNPSNWLTIIAGGGDDTVNINGFGSGFATRLTLDGGAGGPENTLNLNTDPNCWSITVFNFLYAYAATPTITTGTWSQQWNVSQFRLTMDLTIQAQDLSFGGTVMGDGGGPWDLTVNNGGTVPGATFSAIGLINPLDDLTVTTTGTTVLNNSPIVTVGDQVFNDPVMLNNGIVFSGNDVIFNNTVDGAHDLTVNTSGGGTAQFHTAVGSTTPPSSVTTNASPGTLIAGGQVVTTGNQEYNGPVTLGADTTLSCANFTAMGTIDGAYDLAVNTSGSGLSWIRNHVGNTTPLDSLTTNSDGSTTIGGGTVTTAGNQVYNDSLLLDTGSALSCSTGSVLPAASWSIASGAGSASVSADLQFAGTVSYSQEIAGAGGGQFDQLAVTSASTIDLGGSTLSGALLSGFVPTAGQEFVMIDNQTGTAVTGTFGGQPEGSTVNIGGVDFVISYVGGDGNDVVLAAQQAQLAVTVDESTDPVGVGTGAGNLVHTVTAQNAGDLDIATVSIDVAQILPPGVTLDSALPSGTTSFDGTTWSLGLLAASATETLTLTMTVAAGATPGVDVITTSATPTDPSGPTVSESTSVRSSPIPVLAPGGMALLVLVLAGLGVLILRRNL